MKSRYFPAGSIIVRPKDANNVEIGLYGNDPHGRNNAIGYRGKKTNPDFRFRFSSEAERTAYITKYIDDCKKLDEVRAVRKQSNKKARTFEVNPVQVGDVFYSSWGYDQTNIDFFKVSHVKGMMVTLVPVKQERTYRNDMCGDCMPTNVPCGPAIVKRVCRSYSGEPIFRINSVASAYVFDGKPKYWSSYA